MNRAIVQRTKHCESFIFFRVIMLTAAAVASALIVLLSFPVSLFPYLMQSKMPQLQLFAFFLVLKIYSTFMHPFDDFDVKPCIK